MNDVFQFEGQQFIALNGEMSKIDVNKLKQAYDQG